MKNVKVINGLENKANWSKTVLTHDGLFHADEVLAIALISVFCADNIEIVRGRDIPSKGFDVILDVNGVYTPRSSVIHGGDYMSSTWRTGVDIKGEFDHHQMVEADDEYGLSSAGLIYKEIFLRELPVSCETGGCPWEEKIEQEEIPALKKLVREVDQQDVGLKRNDENHFSNVIGGMNHHDIYSEEQNIQFIRAVELTIEIIKLLKVSSIGGVLGMESLLSIVKEENDKRKKELFKLRKEVFEGANRVDVRG